MIFYRKKTGKVYIGMLNLLMGVASPNMTQFADMARPIKDITWLNEKKCRDDLRMAAGTRFKRAFEKGMEQGKISAMINELGGYER